MSAIMETRTSALLGPCGIAFTAGPLPTLPEVPPASTGVLLWELARGQVTELPPSVAVGMHVPTVSPLLSLWTDAVDRGPQNFCSSW
jgi:hypothetical protein